MTPYTDSLRARYMQPVREDSLKSLNTHGDQDQRNLTTSHQSSTEPDEGLLSRARAAGRERAGKAGNECNARNRKTRRKKVKEQFRKATKSKARPLRHAFGERNTCFLSQGLGNADPVRSELSERGRHKQSLFTATGRERELR